MRILIILLLLIPNLALTQVNLEGNLCCGEKLTLGFSDDSTEVEKLEMKEFEATPIAFLKDYDFKTGNYCFFAKLRLGYFYIDNLKQIEDLRDKYSGKIRIPDIETTAGT